MAVFSLSSSVFFCVCKNRKRPSYSNRKQRKSSSQCVVGRSEGQAAFPLQLAASFAEQVVFLASAAFPELTLATSEAH